MMNFLTSTPCSSASVCRNAECPHMTVRAPVTGRWFITMGHAQFNSPANNGKGYATEAAALRAVRSTLARTSH